MKIIRGVGEIKSKYPRAVVAIGIFDGLHRGHQALIRKVVERARCIKGVSIVMTFDPHPVHVLHPEIRLPLITSFPHRLKLIEQLGVDACIVIPFTRAFAKFSPEQFTQKYLVSKIFPVAVIVGDDFRFGKDRSGSIVDFKDLGKRYGFAVYSLHAALNHGKKIVSSTRIRELIVQGKLSKAKALLGRPVSVYGQVVQGDRRGKTLGYPTANIQLSGELLPPQGVYVVRAEVQGKNYFGMANIGRRPSFKQDDKITVEVHLFNFRENIYGRFILLEFLKKIRDEQFFVSQEQLIRQIQADEKLTWRWLKQKNTPA